MNAHRLRTLLIALVLMMSAVPLTAAAHAVVIESSPADRAVLTRVPPEIRLRFNAKLEKNLVHAKLERADGASQTLVDVSPHAARLRFTLPADLQAGAYTLKYKVLATDGHATQGVLRFTLQGLP